MNIRWATEADIPIVVSWWTERKKHAPPVQFIYPGMALAELDGKLLAALSLHLDINGRVAFVAYMASSPHCDADERELALDNLLAFLEGHAAGLGYKVLSCFTDTKPVCARLEKHGYVACESKLILYAKGI